MSLFWVLAAAIPLAAAALLGWPLLRSGGRAIALAIALLLLLPLSTLLLYQGIGTPGGLDAGRGGPQAANQAGDELADLVAELRARLADRPDDVEGWLLLGRSYKTLQHYPEAVWALRQARTAAPTHPGVATELAEALIFTGDGAQPGPEVRALLDEAVAGDPQLQKALWLKGVVAFQDADYAAALDWWQRLSAQLEPGSAVAQSVAAQMDEARRRLGQEATAWPGVAVTVSAVQAPGPLPPNAALFVIARLPGGGGPPLGVVRVANPVLPVSLRLDDAASMLPQRPVSGEARIELVARLSLEGQPMAAPGDWQSAAVLVDTADPPQAPMALELAPPGP